MATMSEPPDRGGIGEGDKHQKEVSPNVCDSDNWEKVKTYSESLKTNMRYDQKLKRNVLEITLEKTFNDATITVKLVMKILLVFWRL